MRAQNTRLERSTPFFDGHGVSGHPDAQRLTSSHRSLWSVVAGPHAYVWLLEASFGATLGKAMVEIRVTRPDGRNAFAASAIRNLLRLVDGLGFYLVGGLVASCSRFRQRLGDICAGTTVVEEEFGLGIKTAAVLLWTTVFVGACWVLPHFCAEHNAANGPRYLNQNCRPDRTRRKICLCQSCAFQDQCSARLG